MNMNATAQRRKWGEKQQIMHPWRSPAAIFVLLMHPLDTPTIFISERFLVVRLESNNNTTINWHMTHPSTSIRLGAIILSTLRLEQYETDEVSHRRRPSIYHLICDATI